MSLCSQPRRDVVILAHLVWTAFRPLPPSIAAAFSFTVAIIAAESNLSSALPFRGSLTAASPDCAGQPPK
jgi:hypothetical protein